MCGFELCGDFFPLPTYWLMGVGGYCVVWSSHCCHGEYSVHAYCLSRAGNGIWRFLAPMLMSLANGTTDSISPTEILFL